MNSEYETYFDRRVAEYQRPVSFQSSLNRPDFESGLAQSMVSEGIALANNDLLEAGGHELRADAQLALYLAFTELVARPVMFVEPLQREELAIDLQADISMIVRIAASEADEVAISAHGIVNAVSSLWPELRTARFQIWDRSD